MSPPVAATSVASVATRLPVPQAVGADLTATASRDVWLHVEVDGQRVFEGSLRAGQSAHWSGKTTVFLWVGNATSLEVIFNGTNVGPLGAPGAVIKRTFQKEPA